MPPTSQPWWAPRNIVNTPGITNSKWTARFINHKEHKEHKEACIFFVSLVYFVVDRARDLRFARLFSAALPRRERPMRERGGESLSPLFPRLPTAGFAWPRAGIAFPPRRNGPCRRKDPPVAG